MKGGTNSVYYLISLVAPLLFSKVINQITDTGNGLMNPNANIAKSSLTPPSWAFGLVWTLLYISIGYVLYYVVTSKNGEPVGFGASVAFYIAFLLNFVWIVNANRPISQDSLKYSFWIIIATIISLVTFFYLNKFKSLNYVLLPYLLWLIFASYLSLYAYRYTIII